MKKAAKNARVDTETGEKNPPRVSEVHQAQCVDTVEADKYTGDVPITFTKWYGGNVARATKMYGRTLQWRKENDLDTILSIRQDHFHEIIKYYPHAIHGRSRDGCVVLYEILGRAQPKELEKVNGLTFDQLVWHFVLRNEYVFQKICTREECLRWDVCRDDEERDLAENIPPELEGKGKLMTVLDVKGIRIADITVDVISFIKKSSEIIDSHFPFRVQRLVICNAPSWFSSVWTMVARVLPDSVRKKISIIHGVDGLNAVIDPSQRPEEYGGTDVPLGQSPEMLGFVALEKGWREAEAAKDAAALEDGRSNGNNTHHRDKRKDGGGYHPVDISKSNSLVNGGSIGNVGLDDGSIGNRDMHGHDDHGIDRSRRSSIDSVDSVDSESSSGVLGWMRSRMFGGGLKEAHLGGKNAYRYDEERGAWALDVDEGSTFNITRRKSLSPAQLEEHGLVLAIQAAHLASRGQRADDTDSDGYDGSRSPYSPKSVRSSGFETPIAPAQEVIERPHKISAQVFLLVLTMYTVACLSQTMITTLIPVWLATNRSKGGLGFTVLDRAYAMSAAGLVVYLVHVFLMHRFAYVLRASPIRALRIGAGFLIVMCFLTPAVLHAFCSDVSTISDVPVTVTKSHQQVIHELYFDMNNAEQEIETEGYTVSHGVEKHTYTPAFYILALPIPALLLAATGRF
jgi:hypothetical protein